MSEQWADDFSRYGLADDSIAAMLDGLVYANIGNQVGTGGVVVSPDPNEAVRAYRLGLNADFWERDFRLALPRVVTGVIGVCFRAWLGNLPLNSDQRPAIVGIQNAAGNTFVYVRIEQNGAIQILRRDGFTWIPVEDTVNPVVQPGAFNHFELVHDVATGSGTLYVNGGGTAVIEYSGIPLGDTAVFVNFSGRNFPGLRTAVWLKDLFIWDGTGTENNSQAGTVIVRRYKPDGDVTLGGWVPSTGTTGFNLLAKNARDDSTYLSGDDTPPAPMQFSLQNLPEDVTSVRAIFTTIRVRKVDGGDANVQTGLSPNGVDWDNGVDRPVTSAFTYRYDSSSLDPDTAAPWTPLAFDSSTVRVDRTV